MIRKIQAKTILSALSSKGEDEFGIRYNINLYRGCQHACIYCDSRSSCYQIENFADIEIKENAVELLKKELPGKRKRGVVGTGCMNDPYMPIEKTYQLTRQALELLKKNQYPVHIITKGDLVLRDIDLLTTMPAQVAVSVSITTLDETLAKILEPGAVSPVRRLAAIKELSEAGVPCGVLMAPILPYLTDSPENIEAIVRQTKANGGHYVLYGEGVTLRDGSREYFYAKLDTHFPGLRKKYERHPRHGIYLGPCNPKELWEIFHATCCEVDIAEQMPCWDTSAVMIGDQFGLFG